MEQVVVVDDGSTASGSTSATSATTPTVSESGNAAMPMTYANLETLTRLNTEDLTHILSSTEAHRNVVEEEDYSAETANGGTESEDQSFIVPHSVDYQQAHDYDASSANAPEGGADHPSTAEDVETSSSQLSVHSYCKQPSGAERSNNNPEGGTLLDIKTILPSPTTRRVLLIDEGGGDLEMAKSDVEFLLRGDAAGIVLREGKRSEVWARFGKVTFQGRKVKGFVACVFCRQVYAFGDAHSTGTSTLKKHRCLAQSLVTTTSASPSPSASADHQSSSSSATFVNFPSPSVIVSIATAVRSSNNSQMCITESSSTPSPIPNASVATRYLNPADRDELIRNTGVVLGSGPIPASSFHQLASALVQLGAKHGAGVLDDFSAIATSPTFESLLPGIFKEYRAHFVEEARSSPGVGLVVQVSRRTQSVVDVNLGLSYCVDGQDSAFFRLVPLRRVQFTNESAELSGRIGQLVESVLKEERLDHLRRSILCDSPEILKEVFTGQMSVPCSLKSLFGRSISAALEACPSRDWKLFCSSIQRLSNIISSVGWESSTGRPVRPVPPDSSALDWMESIINISSQMSELVKITSSIDAAVWAQLNRNLLTQTAAFLSAVVALASKLLKNNPPSLCHVLLVRSHLVSLCTPKPSDHNALAAFKASLLESMSSNWPIEMVHRLACALHPAFKQMRRLDLSDREKMETYAFLRNLIRQGVGAPPQDILRNTLEQQRGGSNNGEVKRKRGAAGVGGVEQPGPKRPRPNCPPHEITLPNFEFSDLADFSSSSSQSSSVMEGLNGPLGGGGADKDELELYLEEKVMIQQDLLELSNVLIYWKRRQSVFPALSQVAFWLLSLPASAECLSTTNNEAAESVLQRDLFRVVAQSNSSASNLVE